MTDEKLISLYRSGDEGAMDELISRYRGLVRAKARRFYLSGGEHEDLIQEGMIGLFKAIRDFDAEKKVLFRFFASMCISRQLATALSASNRSKHIPLNSYISFYMTTGEDNEELKDKLDTGDLSPEDILIDKENFDDLNIKIEKLLSKMEFSVLELFIEGVSYDKIAETVGCDIKAVDNALQRIKRKLSKIDNKIDNKFTDLKK